MTTLTSAPAAVTRRAGTVVERLGWVLPGLLSALMIAIGLQTFLSLDGRDEPISGSACCTGHAFSEVAPWAYDYANELFRYLGTYEVGTGLFALIVVLFGLRHGRRWAWAACWYLPVLFAVHGFVLGSLPFDAVTLVLAVAGQLLMIRPVFRTPAA
jgi:hypothetical protein